ncbi:APC amino acid permease [Laetiporus sulphureus 93-53]|uniref:APC amino acid permease n=1 Tax=Laetiporus sulphureus 93-53 TaxID=1314785 RepID=A0A165FF07_9APHY|nr:APC amino acid permease [Laetiporus sulphureus 93-53]KZT08870.1 APC amino acid permease [Laetiporus sulphureus 93-53]
MANARQRQEGADALELARLGYKQEFKRAFSPLEVFGLVFSIFGLFPSIASVLTYALPNGGPVSMVWGWAVCSFFLLLITLSLAELGSAAPTSGGLYYWSFKFASPRWRRLLSWIVGYSNTIGLIAGVASVDWGCAVQLMAAVSIGHNQEFSATTGETYAVFVLILLLHAMISSLATAVVARLQTVYVVLNVLLCLAIIIALPAATPAEYVNSASYAFGGFVNFTAWPDGFAFVLSFLAPLWTISGFDSALHISEEASNASVAVPWALISATSVAGVLGWAINVALAFRMGTDLESIMNSPIDQPMAVILYNSFGQRGTLAVWSVVVAVQFFMGTSSLLASSRQTFAFARDGGLPFSNILYRVNPYTKTPINCAWFAAFIAGLLGLLAFAGDAAISAVFSLGVVGLYIAYIIPIISRFAGGTRWRPGPFSLGRMGFPVAAIALAWMFFSIAILLFPSDPAPDAPNMNYTVVVLGGWLTLCLVYYYFPVYGGVHWFRGPIANVDVGAGDESDSKEVEKAGIEEEGSSVDEKRNSAED